jgi:hypothetical protein
MARRLFTILSALSLLLCVATVVLWVRSYWATDLVGWTRADRRVLGAGGMRGRLVLVRTVPTKEMPDYFRPNGGPGWRYYRGEAGSGWALEFGEGETGWRLAGLRYAEGPQLFSHCHALVVPCWLLLVGFGTPLVGWLSILCRRHSRERRRQEKLCRHCGYDLRATPGRCPECGTPAALTEA